MKIVFEKRFLKDVEVIQDRQLRGRIESVLDEIESVKSLNAISNLKKMKGHSHAYRIRIGDWRLGFFFQNDTIIITRVLHRKELYRYFP